MRHFRPTLLGLFFLAASLFLSLSVTSASSNVIHVIKLDDDSINPVTSEYIIHAIDRAYEEGAQCLVIKLDTPGGLLSSTRLIVKKILAAKLPVIVYISPSGARAGSAGVFITYASHVAAMAPSTNIGAAHPVEIGGRGPRESEDPLKMLNKNSKKNLGEKKENEADSRDPMSDKILNDTVAFIKAMAKERHRNEEWAVKSVTQSVSITENEALQNHVVEILAKDDEDLFAQLNDRVVKINGAEVALKTKDASVKRIDMNPRQQFFNVLANPNIAYIFLMLGFYGLLYEITHPGFGLPGILGAIFLILAFFSLQMLPTNYAALALLILSVALLIAEANTPGIGLLAGGGVLCMILGSMLLFDSPLPNLRVSLSVIFSFTATTALITLFLVRASIMSHRGKIMGGKEGLLGAIGEAYTDLRPGVKGKVFVHGEIWNAAGSHAIKKGDPIIVTDLEGLTLKVKKHS